jgi:glycosyltransferase involved in cell wall biosynthesis
MIVKSKIKKIILSVTNDMVIDQRVHRIATTLVENGVDVLVVGRKMFITPDFSDRIYKVKLLKLPFKKGFQFYLTYNIWLFFFLLFKRLDALVANDLDTLPANYFASKIKRVPLIFDSHEYFPEVPEVVKRRGVKRVWLAIEKWMVPYAKYRYTVCKSIAELYKEKYNLQFEVVRNLPFKKDINIVFESISNLSNKKIIIYQGAINVGRGIELMMDTIKYLDNVELKIAGTGPMDSAIRQKATEPELEDKVQILGRLPFKELHKYTVSADLGFSLEENLGLNYFFALPNKLFDYIQAGIPVITSDFPEMKAIVEKYNIGITTNERDPMKLAIVINEMLNNTEQMSTWKENAKIASEELCWEKEREVLITIYQNAGLFGERNS